MSKNNIYLIIHALLCVFVTALLCLSVIHLYQEGISIQESGDVLAPVYTRERITDQLFRVSLPFFGAIGFMIAGLVLGIRDPHAMTPVSDAESTRDFLAHQSKEYTAAIRKEQSLQKKFLLGGWTGFGLCMIPVLAYLLDPGHFPADDLEQMFHSLLPGILPWTALGLGCLLLFSLLRRRSITRQIALLKDPETPENTDGSRQAEEMANPLPGDRRKRLFILWIRILLVTAAVAMIIAGALNGSLKDVLIKAINLCTECVGLG